MSRTFEGDVNNPGFISFKKVHTHGVAHPRCIPSYDASCQMILTTVILGLLWFYNAVLMRFDPTVDMVSKLLINRKWPSAFSESSRRPHLYHLFLGPAVR